LRNPPKFTQIGIFGKKIRHLATPRHTRSFFPGLFWRQFVFGGAEPEAWKYLSVALPTACVAGPLGALLVSHCHRLVHATTCYTLDTIALVTLLPSSLYIF
jgi:hypothetical protein